MKSRHSLSQTKDPVKNICGDNEVTVPKIAATTSEFTSASNKVKDSLKQRHAITFVDKEHFGPLIGKGGKNKLKLEHQFSIKLKFDNDSGVIHATGESNACLEFEKYCEDYVEIKGCFISNRGPCKTLKHLGME